MTFKNDKPLSTFLKIRLLQAKNFIQETPLVYFLATLVAYTAFCIYVANIKEPQTVVLITLLLTLITCFNIQKNRKDHNFLKTITQQSNTILRLEYATLSLIILWPILITNYYYTPILAIPIISFITPLLNSKKQETHLSLSKLINKIIPVQNFEWRSAINRNPFTLISLYILLISSLQLNYVSLFISWALTMYLVSFYNYCEPIHILSLELKTPKKFIHQKLKNELKLFLILFMPIVIAQCIIQPHIWYISIVLFSINTLIYCCSILFKYYKYFPGQDITDLTTTNSIIYFSPIIIFLIPMPIIYFFNYYNGAQKSLNKLINASN